MKNKINEDDRLTISSSSAVGGDGHSDAFHMLQESIATIPIRTTKIINIFINRIDLLLLRLLLLFYSCSRDNRNVWWTWTDETAKSKSSLFTLIRRRTIDRVNRKEKEMTFFSLIGAKRQMNIVLYTNERKQTNVKHQSIDVSSWTKVLSLFGFFKGGKYDQLRIHNIQTSVSFNKFKSSVQ